MMRAGCEEVEGGWVVRSQGIDEAGDLGGDRGVRREGGRQRMTIGTKI